MKKNKANKQTNKRVFMLKVQGPQNWLKNELGK